MAKKGGVGAALRQRVAFAGRWRKLLIGLGLALVILLIAGVNVYHNRQGVQIPVRVEPVRVLQLENTVFATGTVHPVEQQEFYAVGAAVVAEVLVREGDRVEAGQVLGCLDDTAFRKELRDAEALLATRQAALAKATTVRPEELAQAEAQVRQAELQLEAARRQAERLRYLREHEAASVVELESAELELVRWEGELESARARLDALLTGPDAAEREALIAQVEQAQTAVEIARQRLARATLRAAMDGVVYRVEIRAGQPVSPNAFLLSVVSLEQMEIRAEVGEADAELLEVGQRVRIISAARPEETFSGEVARIAPGAVSRTGPHGEQNVVPVVIEINNADTWLRPGYSVDLEIVTVEMRDVLAVPYEAVVELDDGTWVFVVEGDRVKRREVQVRRGNELYEEVVSGLAEGEMVVIGPPDHLQDGDRVRALRGGGADAAR
jgi:HlyD family secretion protein